MPGFSELPNCHYACAQVNGNRWWYVRYPVTLSTRKFSHCDRAQSVMVKWLHCSENDRWPTVIFSSAVWAQCDSISNLIVLDFSIKALFSSYDVICLPRTLLWRLPFFPDNQSARSGSPCIFILESIQHLQLQTVKLRSKHAILADWI